MLEENFLLEGEAAGHLYKDIAKDAPIYDYHCHLSAREICEDRVFTDITSLWLEHDHYKWRAMRYAGVKEELITGEAGGLDKFKAWAKVCERLIGSPLYHWANMELKTYFGISEILREENAERIYHLCKETIDREKLSPVTMIRKAKVELICTTDDPIDGLEYHKQLAGKADLGFRVLPAFRPDKALNIRKPDFKEYIDKLGKTGGKEITCYSDLISVLQERIRFFKEAGCRMSDHSIESLQFEPVSCQEAEEIFRKFLLGKEISKEEAEKYKLYTLILLAAEYKKAGWVMQLHIGAYRNANELMHKKLGADAGFDIMNDFEITDPLVHLLNEMEKKGGLPKMVLYNLNPKDNLVLASLPHCFTEGGIPGKIQFGPAWWFCDHKEGILTHLKTIASQGMLAEFTGMLTDSRSFLSYVRHDYFRRILCSYIGGLVDNGEFGKDEKVLKELVEGICYKNIIRYLAIKE